MQTKILLSVIIVGLFESALFAQAGTLDSLFSGDGKVITSIGPADSYPFGMAIQPDGKIIVVGNTSTNDTVIKMVLVRYKTNGSMDTGFGVNGKTSTSFAGKGPATALSIALQPDGKIVVAGIVFDELWESDFALVRYMPNGSLDTSFSTDGKLTTSFLKYDGANSVCIQPDGKIVAAGIASDDPYGATFALSRYNIDGSLDETFGDGGKQITIMQQNASGQFCSINGMAIQPDGKIVVAGNVYNGIDYDFGLARYYTSGILDSSFGSNGKVITPYGSADNELNAITLQPDGKIVVAGYYSHDFYDYDFALARYQTNGVLDHTFGSDGVTTSSFDIDNADRALSVSLQNDGKIVVGGFTHVNFSTLFALARYDINGILDDGFGTGGKVAENFSLYPDYGQSIGIQPDGKIVISGSSAIPNGNRAFGVARYLSGLNVGVLDLSFSSNSVLIYPIPIEQNTSLKYILNKQDQISIDLLDVNGKLIKRLIDNQLQTIGEYEQTLELPEYLPSGFYFIALSATDGGRVIIKIVK